MAEDSLVQLTIARDEVTAGMMVQALEGAGIMAIDKEGGNSGLFGVFTKSSPFYHEIQVRADDVESAREVLRNVGFDLEA